MRVLHVASEVAPFAMSGGLADVVAGLPAAQADSSDVRVAVLVPLYRGVEAKITAAKLTLSAPIPLPITVGPNAFGAALRIVDVGRVRYGFLDCPQLYDRVGGLYGPSGIGEWGDNHIRFGALGAVALDAGRELLGGVDVLHVHDWQGGPAAIYARLAQPSLTIVATIHNLAYRGIFHKKAMTDLGFPWTLFDQHLLEFWDQVSLLKGGLALADAVTTVSPTYAKEILTPALGEGLDGFLVHDVERLVGIVNGIDDVAWDPATDPALPVRFSADDLSGKAACRRALANETKLPLADDDILVGVIARMTGQKGLDLVAEIVPHLHVLGMRLVVLGSGEPDFEARFRYLADTFTESVHTSIGFDLAFARRIYAGCDLFLMPSRFEPCGLGQLYAMRYGTLPVVHAVGGLVDTVDDARTGFSFTSPTSTALLATVERAAIVARDPIALSTMRRHAMARDSSWTAPAREMIELYRSLRA